MKILISNDDGIESIGIQALASAVARLGTVTVVAPERERSTVGHSLTLHKPLRVYERGPGQYATSGSPADCVYLAVRAILGQNPDILLSGINRGANLGNDIFYSGTVAAAREGAQLEIPSYAFSLVYDDGSTATEEDFAEAAEIACAVIEKYKNVKFPSQTLLNVNIPKIPKKERKGICVARQGFRHYANSVLKRDDPRGRSYYWLGGTYQRFEPIEQTDCLLLSQGWTTVVPLTLDTTHNDFYATLRDGF